MNILLLGPQGSGKGTQARIICEKFNFDYFESGAYLRRMVEEHPDIKKTMDEGKLVPDKEFTSYLTAYLDQENMYDNIVFDGFPRTIIQYNFLKNWLTDRKIRLDLVLVLQISDKLAIERLSTRRLDPVSGKIYNLITELPPENVDKSKLVQRDDDMPKSIKKRLSIYRNETESMINELKKETEVVEVDGERPIDVISKDLIDIIQKRLDKEK